MFSPNKEAELFRQQLDSISVRGSNARFSSFLPNSAKMNAARLRSHCLYPFRCSPIFSSLARENLEADSYGNHWWFRYESRGWRWRNNRGGLFIESLHFTLLDWERVEYPEWGVTRARVSVTSVSSTANTPAPNYWRYSSARLLLLYPFQLLCHRWKSSRTTANFKILLFFLTPILAFFSFLNCNIAHTPG